VTARLAIPPQLARSLAALGALDDETFSVLRAQLNSVDGMLTREALVDRLSAVIERDLADGLLAALADAMAARPETRDTIGGLVAGSLVLDDASRLLVPTIAERLDMLLATGGPALLAIKRDSTVSDQRVMLDKARIATDIRPVFADTGESVDVTTEVGAVIVHTLRLDVFENWRPVSLYVALPEDGLALLKSVIERAEHKQQVLTEALGTGQLRLLPESL
jgi:hypothetical protein